MVDCIIHGSSTPVPPTIAIMFDDFSLRSKRSTERQVEAVCIIKTRYASSVVYKLYD